MLESSSPYPRRCQNESNPESNKLWAATEQRKLDRENDTAFQEIEDLFHAVATGIRLRVSP